MGGITPVTGCLGSGIEEGDFDSGNSREMM